MKLESAGVSINHFDAIVGGDMVEKIKPYPDCYLLACETLGVKPKHTLVGEDSDVGIQSAHAAGCNVIWVPDIQKVDPKIQKLAWCKVKSLDEIIPILQGVEK